MRNSKFIQLILIVFSLFFFPEFHAQVKVYEGKETIPTYRLGPDEPSPVFYTGRGVQGAAGHIYPYPAQINLGDKKTDVTYDMVYLENEFIKVTIAPGFGGRIFSAIDKSNGHEIFHRNSTIKPDLIGTLGAWISGGVEWCYPHHHRTSTLMKTDYRIVENPDGSATVWVGETEKSLGLRGIIGITLRPGRSYIEADYRLSNPTPLTQNFLFWANVSVTADENFRTFWPPSQEIGVNHHNSSFTHWPISHEVYRGVDYTRGVDLSWWKNHPSPVSIFFWQAEEGFIGGYDYAQEAGTIHVGDTYKSRASKLWQFGPGLEGQNARRKLTDDGIAYVELMTGTFSNNQPDYSWFAPQMVKDAKHYWYPLRDIEMAKNANKDAAITLQVKNEKEVMYGVNVTRVMNGARIVLEYHGEEVVSEYVDVGPASPFTSTWKPGEKPDKYALKLIFFDEDGNELLAYTPYKPENPELPEIMEKFKPAEEIDNPEDLYLTGRWVDQFSRPGMNPDDYYLRVLELSPDDYRANLALGIRRVKQWRFTEAEKFLETAALKLKYRYIQPEEGELYYYWGLAQRAQGKIKEAFRSFSLAAYDYAWFSAANYQLAQMESETGQSDQALKYIDDAWSTNIRNGNIALLYSALLRKAGRGDEAVAILDRAISFDPLNFALMYEKYLITDSSPIRNMQDKMQDVENIYTGIATHYLNAGMYREAAGVLSEVKDPASPLFLYYKAYATAMDGNNAEARDLLIQAGNKSLDYVFPYRIESEKVLKFAAEAAPENAAPLYLLGNLLYEKRPAEAMKAWKQAVEINEGFAMAWRNLAFGTYYHERDADKATGFLQQALELTPDHPYWYSELVNYYEASGRDPQECQEILDAHSEIAIRDLTSAKDLVKLYNLTGNYDKAIALLDNHHFRTWEGGRSIYWHYVDAHVLTALELMEEKKHREAMDHLNRATEYPENLEVGKPLNDERNAMIWYYLAQTAEKMGKKKEAKTYYEKCINARNSDSWPDLVYYQALAYRETGNDEKAVELMEGLEDAGNKLMGSSADSRGIGVEEAIAGKNLKSLSDGYYLLGLAALGRGNETEAGEFFRKAVEVNPWNVWARAWIDGGGLVVGGG